MDMNGIFGNGVAFDVAIFEEWERDEIIDKIILASDDYSSAELRDMSIFELNEVYQEVIGD